MQAEHHSVWFGPQCQKLKFNSQANGGSTVRILFFSLLAAWIFACFKVLIQYLLKFESIFFFLKDNSGVSKKTWGAAWQGPWRSVGWAYGVGTGGTFWMKPSLSQGTEVRKHGSSVGPAPGQMLEARMKHWPSPERPGGRDGSGAAPPHETLSGLPRNGLCLARGLPEGSRVNRSWTGVTEPKASSTAFLRASEEEEGDRDSFRGPWMADSWLKQSRQSCDKTSINASKYWHHATHRFGQQASVSPDEERQSFPFKHMVPSLHLSVHPCIPLPMH